MPRNRDVGNLLGSLLVDVIHTAGRASRQDPDAALVSILSQFNRILNQSLDLRNPAGPSPDAPRARPEDLVERAFTQALGRPATPGETTQLAQLVVRPMQQRGVPDAEISQLLANMIRATWNPAAAPGPAPPTPPAQAPRATQAHASVRPAPFETRPPTAPFQAAPAPGTGRRINIRRKDP